MANGSYIASAAEAERNRRFQAEQNYQSREMQKGMFGAELDFKKTQYNNLWDIQKANLDAERSVMNKFLINEEKRSDYQDRLEDIQEVQDIGMLDVVFGDKTGEEWGTGMRQRWGQRLNPWAKTDEELAGEPEYEEITPTDLKNIDMNTLMKLVQGGFLANQDTDATTGLMQMLMLNQGMK